jgi:pyruvate/2-oxoacid:ferredoxin oxidoreductase alpha subunit
MSNVQIMTGNSAAAYGAKLCKVQVISAYPITPSTSVTETIANWVERGELKAEYVRVESEHSVMTVCVAASTVGARVFTSTSSHGLLYMHEQLHWAAGSRLPIVLCCVNRGVGAPWSIFNDQQDSIAQRDTGWIQIYCRDNQEIIDSVIQAYRIAEEVYCPVMVCYDGFVLSHTMMPVDIPDAEQVCGFLPPYKPHTILCPEDPRNINPVIFPWQRRDAEGILRDGYMDMRYKLQHALEGSRDVIVRTCRDFGSLFGRDHGGMLWGYRTDDAEVLIAGMGSIATEATMAADMLREAGIRAGVVGIRVYRPFPREEVREAFRGVPAIVVFEKNISYGYEGALCADIKAALYGTGIDAPIHNFIAGLGGRDVKASELAEAVRASLTAIAAGKREQQTWLNCVTE